MSTGSLLMITGKTTGKANRTTALKSRGKTKRKTKGTNAGMPTTRMSTEDIEYSLKTAGDLTTDDGRDVHWDIVDNYKEDYRTTGKTTGKTEEKTKETKAGTPMSEVSTEEIGYKFRPTERSTRSRDTLEI